MRPSMYASTSDHTLGNVGASAVSAGVMPWISMFQGSYSFRGGWMSHLRRSTTARFDTAVTPTAHALARSHVAVSKSIANHSLTCAPISRSLQLRGAEPTKGRKGSQPRTGPRGSGPVRGRQPQQLAHPSRELAGAAALQVVEELHRRQRWASKLTGLLDERFGDGERVDVEQGAEEVVGVDPLLAEGGEGGV